MRLPTVGSISGPSTAPISTASHDDGGLALPHASDTDGPPFDVEPTPGRPPGVAGHHGTQLGELPHPSAHQLIDLDPAEVVVTVGHLQPLAPEGRGVEGPAPLIGGQADVGDDVGGQV